MEPALSALRAARATTAQILATLDDAAWARSGHALRERSVRVEDWLRIYARHAHEHADQIRRAGGATD